MLAVLETSFVTGLAVPSGVATAAATVLAGTGVMAFHEVAAAAVAGGWVGDSTGYWIGRRLGPPTVSPRGRLGASLQRARTAASRFLGRHPFFSVTTARLVPFVRTLMPLGAGSSGLGYARFLAWEAPGLIAWAAMYMSAGYLARQSWVAATRMLGLGWTVVFLVAGLVLWIGRRWAVRADRRATGAGHGDAGTGEPTGEAGAGDGPPDPGPAGA